MVLKCNTKVLYLCSHKVDLLNLDGFVMRSRFFKKNRVNESGRIRAEVGGVV
jgi:hypothetical protein